MKSLTPGLIPAPRPQRTYPPRDGSEHRLYNAGVAGSGNDCEPFVMCWLPRLPQRIDLALIETHVHEANRPSDHDANLEHLVRQLLTWGGGALPRQYPCQCFSALTR